MEFAINRRSYQPRGYHQSVQNHALAFAAKLKEKLPIIKAVQLLRPPMSEARNDIPLRVIIDDRGYSLSTKDIEQYLHNISNLVKESKQNYTVSTKKLSEHFSLIQKRNQDYLTQLMDSMTLYDAGFIFPVKNMIVNGRIRPSKEAMWLYFARSQTTLKRSRKHLLQATLDLYWAAIDAAHAALMKRGVMPGQPGKVASMLDQHLKVEEKYIHTLQDIYEVSRQIIHGERQEISGEDYYHKHRNVVHFVKEMTRLVSA